MSSISTLSFPDGVCNSGSLLLLQCHWANLFKKVICFKTYGNWLKNHRYISETTFSKGQTKSSHKTKDKVVDQGLDYTHFKKANVQTNDDEWLKCEINLIKSATTEKNETNDNGKDEWVETWYDSIVTR